MASSSPRRLPTASGRRSCRCARPASCRGQWSARSSASSTARAKLELHRDAIHPDERILIIDDVLATGGTAAATSRLVETLGGTIVGVGVLIELLHLGGRAALGDRRVESLAEYE